MSITNQIPVAGESLARLAFRGWRRSLVSRVIGIISVCSTVICPSLNATTVRLTSPLSPVSVSAGTSLTISAEADDPANTLQQHWLEIKRPAGDWNWEGWLIQEPFAGGISGSSHSSKSGSFTFITEGVYVVRSTAISLDGVWAISKEVNITVTSNTSVTLVSPSSNISVNVGTSMSIEGAATNSAGDLQEHWLEIKRPAGDWNWEGWLISPPFDGSLGGNGSSSHKSGSFTFTDAGAYTIRTTAMDRFGNWKISAERKVTVFDAASNHAPTVSIIPTSVVSTPAGKVITVVSSANDADGNLVTHFIGYSNVPGSAITPTTATGGSASVCTTSVFVPNFGAVALFGVATDSVGATTSAAVILR